MNKKISISFACALALGTMLAASEDLGTISVESTTIDDKFESQTTKVSNTIVINGEKIEEINPQSLKDVLNQIPGMTLQQSEGDIVKIHIRGISNEAYMGEDPGVAIVIDGVPVDETAGKINVDLDNIESIRVIKGGASYLYGNDALAGAVVITTKRPKGKSFSKIEAEVGSFGKKRVVVSTNQGLETGSLRLQATDRESDGYWHDAYLKHKSINGKYQHYIDDSSDVIFGIDYTTRKTGDGSTVSSLTNAINDPKSINDLSYSGFYDSTLIKTFATYSKDFEDESNLMFNAYSYTDDKTNYSARLTKFSDEKWVQNGIKAEYRKPQVNYAYMVGIDIQRNSTDGLSYESNATTKVVGALSSDTNTDEDTNSIYGELKNELSENLTTTLNFRQDNMKYAYVDDMNSTKNVDPSYKNSSYRVGLNYKINSNTNLYASVSTGFKAPTASQISKNRITAGAPADIDSEETTNYEIGVLGSVSNLKYEASIYQLDRDNYIGYSNGNYSWGDYYDNIGDIRSRGFELGLSSDRKKELSFNLGYAYLKSKFRKYFYNAPGPDPLQDLSGKYVSRAPKHTANLTLDYKPTAKLTISPELVYYGSYFADEANRYKQDGYKVVNLRGNYKFNQDLEFFAKIDNLLDKDYYAFVNVNSKTSATMNDATIRVAAPRAYYVGLRYKF